MSNIGHRSLFNQLLSNLLVDNTRDLTIFFDERSLSDHHFRTLIALETALFKENSSRNASRFKVRNVRRLGIHINDIILILGSLMSSRFVIKCKGSI